MSFDLDVMVGMGFTREEVRESLINQKYNEVTATYLLLARKNEVSKITKGTKSIFHRSSTQMKNI